MALSPTTSRGSSASAGVTVDSYVAATSSVAVTGSFASPDTVVTAAAVTAAGSVVYCIEFFCPYLTAGAATTVAVYLYDGGTKVGALASVVNPDAASLSYPLSLAAYVTPTAAAHTYSIRAGKSGAAVAFNAGAGSAGADWPLFVRVSHGV